MTIKFEDRLAELEKVERLGPVFSIGEFALLTTITVLLPVILYILTMTMTR